MLQFESLKHECSVYIGAMPLMQKFQLKDIAKRTGYNLEKTKKLVSSIKVKPIEVDILFVSLDKHPNKNTRNQNLYHCQKFVSDGDEVPKPKHPVKQKNKKIKR